jgi:hypothetical protein
VRPAAEAAYLVAAAAFLGIAVRTWALKPPVRVAMAQLLPTSALVAPHLFVHNRTVVVPALLVIEDVLQARQAPEPSRITGWSTAPSHSSCSGSSPPLLVCSYPCWQWQRCPGASTGLHLERPLFVAEAAT